MGETNISRAFFRAFAISPGLVAKYRTWRSNGGGARRSAGVGQWLVAAGPCDDWGPNVWQMGMMIRFFADDEKKRSYVMYVGPNHDVHNRDIFLDAIRMNIWLVPSCLLLDLHMAMTDSDSWTWEFMSPLIRLK